ncbi:MAG: sigma-54 dependent transcriptional regulator [Planctomycetales bacterium]
MRPALICFSGDESLSQVFGPLAPVTLTSKPRDFETGLADATHALLDLRQIDAGGHRQADWLEQIAILNPAVRWTWWVNGALPETLERLAVCLQATLLHSKTELADWYAGLTPPAQSVVPAPELKTSTEPETAFRDEEAVLSGLTRRFETRTPRVRQMLSELEVAARHDVTTLLIGETGSGKTFLSRLIHEISPRHDEPFLPVACGALPAELIESELFGHVRGAFTSAHADKEGKFLAAGRGTILLDEIDVLGPDQQVKLLRVIETGEFEPVGSNRTVKSQARLIVASNLELQPLVEQGRFRPDLYYRLNMLKFEVPPLRTRQMDIIPMAHKFIAEMAQKHHITIQEVDQTLLDALVQYPWPGNVRELENVIQRAVIYCKDGVLSARQLPSYIQLGIVGPSNDASVRLEAHTNPASSLGRQIAYTERDIIEQTLSKNNFSRTKTAKALGISRVTLYNKMKKYGMGS